MSNVVQIYDTTLRDGSQAEDIAFFIRMLAGPPQSSDGASI